MNSTTTTIPAGHYLSTCFATVAVSVYDVNTASAPLTEEDLNLLGNNAIKALGIAIQSNSVSVVNKI